MATRAVSSGFEGQGAANSTGAGVHLLAFAEALILAVWLGSMIFFSFAVAPSAFAVLPSRHLAGEVVNSSIGKLEILGLIAGGVLLLIQVAGWKRSQIGTFSKVLRLFGLLIMIAAAAGSKFWISPSMRTLRAVMGGAIDDVAPGDPLRIQFDALHQYSVALMGTAMLAGVVVLFLTVHSWLKR
jgi:hypothetical protein